MHVPQRRASLSPLKPLHYVSRAPFNVYTNALEALALHGECRKAQVHWHPGGQLACLERASERFVGS